MQVVAGPRAAREEAPGLRVVQRGVLGARVAWPKASSPRQVRRKAPEPWLVQEEAQAPPKEPEPVVYWKNLLEKEKQK
jgi:hypothetical protein